MAPRNTAGLYFYQILDCLVADIHSLGEETYLMKRGCIAFAFLAAFLLSASLSPLWSQGGGGSISGAVTDSSGALIADASVEITNIATGVVQKTNTTSAGQYVFPVVPTGTYKVIVNAAGFVQAIVTNV